MRGSFVNCPDNCCKTRFGRVGASIVPKRRLMGGGEACVPVSRCLFFWPHL